MSKLKACPFCGNKNIHIESCKDLEDCGNFEECYNDGYVAVICSFNNGGCGASSGYRKSSDEAMEAWNYREAK